jgi:hypothetical protein
MTAGAPVRLHVVAPAGGHEDIPRDVLRYAALAPARRALLLHVGEEIQIETSEKIRLR